MSGIAKTPEEVDRYCKCTLLAATIESDGGNSQADSLRTITDCVTFLQENEFIRFVVLTLFLFTQY